MLDILVAMVFVAIIVAIFTVPVGMFNTKMFHGANGSRATGMEVLKAYVPFGNLRYARVLSYGASPVYLVLLILAGLLIVVRLVSVAIFQMVPVLLIFTPWCVIAAFLIWYILAVVNALDFANMLGAGLVTKLFCIICAPLGYYMLAQVVLPYFKAEEENISGTFEAQD